MLVKRKVGSAALVRVKKELEGRRYRFRSLLLDLPIAERDMWILADESLPDSVLNEFKNDHPLPWDDDGETDAVKTTLTEFLGSSPGAVCALEEGCSLDHPEHSLIWYDSFGTCTYIIDHSHGSPEYVNEVVEEVIPFAFLACLTSLPLGVTLPAPKSALSEDLVASLVERTEMLIVQAYENGGYIYWQRP